AQQLEALGFPILWINETTGRDPFVLATMLLSSTSSLKLATGIANIYARDALTMSACQKTLAEAFPGRFVLGLGVSSPVLVEKVRKHSYDKPLSYMREYLEAMDAAPYHSVPPSDAPVRVLAALGPKMLELAGTRADGAHPYLTTPDHTRQAREILGPDVLLAPEQMVVLETDPDTARAIARPAVGFYLRAPGYLANLRRMGFTEDDWADPKNPPDRLIDGLVAWGGLEAIARRVREHHDAGADHVCIQVLAPPGDLPLTQWRELASAVL
ncbi:MAG: TIGR03620 family F420-dependent LLM class oxidoreductase, partial [Acidimicrobiaceae bacterium]|nr:TIGR03620 family F420-dependent LLM class oxidoreductase [Acidimicrobiaceae bacterium]